MAEEDAEIGVVESEAAPVKDGMAPFHAFEIEGAADESGASDLMEGAGDPDVDEGGVGCGIKRGDPIGGVEFEEPRGHFVEKEAGVVENLLAIKL